MWRGRRSDSPAARTGTRGSMWGYSRGESAARGARERRGSRAASSGVHGCGRAPLSAAISAAFPSAAAAAREPLSSVTNMPCGQVQPPRRFPSVATFTRALGPLLPRMIVKRLYGQQINVLCKVRRYRLGLRGVLLRGWEARWEMSGRRRTLTPLVVRAMA